MGKSKDKGPEIPDLAALPPALSDSLRQNELVSNSKSEELCRAAETLLGQTGQETTINGVPSVVTSYFFPVKNDDVELFARLGRHTPRKGQEPDALTVVFCKTPDIKGIQTPNFHALRFVPSAVTGQAELMAHHGVEPITNDPDYLKLTEKIIKNISQQLDKDQERGRQRVAARIERAKNLAFNVGATAVGGGVLLGFAYGHLLFGHIDAKLGPVPMPGPVEWIVDIANQPDHQAQGFPKPAGALPLTLGPIERIPVLSDYNTDGVPDTSEIADGWGDHNDQSYQGEITHPGLYESDFNFSSKDKQSARFGKDGCYDIIGNFATGAEIFTQTYNLGDIVSVTETDTHTIKVCKRPGAPDTAAGSIFIFTPH